MSVIAGIPDPGTGIFAGEQPNIGPGYRTSHAGMTGDVLRDHPTRVAARRRQAHSPSPAAAAMPPNSSADGSGTPTTEPDTMNRVAMMTSSRPPVLGDCKGSFSLFFGDAGSLFRQHDL